MFVFRCQLRNLANATGLEFPNETTQRLNAVASNGGTPLVVSENGRILGVVEWQDVEELMERGISVITAVNVQHLESLHEQVLKITGTDVTERIPDRLLREADEVVNIDLTG